MITRSKNKPITSSLRSSTRNERENSRKNEQNKPKSSLISEKTSNICKFCLTGRRNDYLLGDLRYSSKDVVVHKFCMYFSPKLPQNGSLHDNFWGFKHDDIFKELKRCSKIRCYYCFRRGASIICSQSNCRIKFHLPCGLENESFHQYHDDKQLYQSYCKRHRPSIEIPEYCEPVPCTICQESAEITERNNLFYVPCCRSYFHQTCIKNLAFHQGQSWIKCPNCNNIDQFVNQIKKCGYFVPPRGPSWAMSPAYAIDRITVQCAARECKCEYGRMYSDLNLWRFFCCNTCKVNWMHVGCIESSSEISENDWICEHCS